MTSVAKINPHLSQLECPDVLRNIKGWLAWRYEPGKADGSRPRKVPHYASGGVRRFKHGTPEDRAQLATFEAALAAAARKGFDGIGLALLPDWGVVALDFDHVAQDGQVLDQVEHLLTDTYCEFSPSGSGVRAFYRGQAPNRKSFDPPFSVETFHSAGFVTFTGNRLPMVDLLGTDNTVAEMNSDVQELIRSRWEKAHGPAPRVQSAERLGLTVEQIEDMLSLVDPDIGYDEWLHLGMALHHETGGEGFDLWDDWSSKGTKYLDREDLQRRWDGFGRRDGKVVTIRTLMKTVSEQGGNLPAVAASPDEFTDLDQAQVGKHRPAYSRLKNGQIEPTLNNLLLALADPDECGHHLATDEFLGEVMKGPGGNDGWSPVTDNDMTAVQARLESRGVGFKPIPRQLMRDAVHLVAERHSFDSAITWLTSRVPAWDGAPRVENYLQSHWNAADSPYHRAVSLYMWTALAGRVMSPGCKADMAPILIGPQGCGKSTGVAAMAPALDFFTDINFSDKDVDLSRRIKGKLVIEIAELRGLHTRELGAIKHWLTQPFEQWTPKYRERQVRYLRRCVLFGTTNEQEFLADETGNRRWLPVVVGKIDVDAITRDNEQLWAEARELFRHGGVAWKAAHDLAEGVHADHMLRDVWQDTVEAWLDTPDGPDGETPRSRKVLQIAEVAREALGVTSDKANDSTSRRIRKVLISLGYEGGKVVRTGNTLRKGYTPKG